MKDDVNDVGIDDETKLISFRGTQTLAIYFIRKISAVVEIVAHVEDADAEAIAALEVRRIVLAKERI